MKSRGLFPHRAAAKGYRNNSAAGQSSGDNRPPASQDGYKTGMVGQRASSPGGGTKMADKMDGRPRGDDRSGSGQGGWAWDASVGAAMGAENNPDPPGRGRR